MTARELIEKLSDHLILIHQSMYISRCVGNNLMFQAINSLANNQLLPSQEEVCDALEKNR